MLILTRSKGEKIFIDHEGERLEVLIADINIGQIRIGFEGSKRFKIKRDNIKKLFE